MFGKFCNPNCGVSSCCGPADGDHSNSYVEGDENSRKTCISFRWENILTTYSFN